MTISNFVKMAPSSPETVENTLEKEQIARYEQFLLFPVFSKDVFSRHVKTRACLGKG